MQRGNIQIGGQGYDRCIIELDNVQTKNINVRRQGKNAILIIIAKINNYGDDIYVLLNVIAIKNVMVIVKINS
jgi:hypothetical protein